MKQLYLFSIIFFLSTTTIYGQWENLNSGINDELNDLVFFDSKGVVVGENGIYYTDNPSDGSESWTKLTYNGTSTDSAVYENSRFLVCSSDPNDTGGDGVVYIAGQNRVDNSAVLMRLDLQNLDLNIIYKGNTDTSINDLIFYDRDNLTYAVGSNGLLLKIQGNEATPIITNFLEDLLSIDFNNGEMLVHSKNILGSFFYGSGQQDNLEFKKLEFSETISSITSSYNSIFIVGPDNYMRIWNFSNPEYYYNNNFYNSLNPNTIVPVQSFHFVGTDNGILKSGISREYLELQPSSENYSINAICKSTFDNKTLFACGKNGTILKTTNLGGETTPYLELSNNGSCVNNGSNVKFYMGSSTDCNWVLDGQEIDEDCGNYFYNFDAPGTHTLQVSTTNDTGGSASVSIEFTVVDRPETNKTLIVPEDILCKEGYVNIEILNSEIGFVYELWKRNGTSVSYYGTSPEGNGETIILESDLITETGEYYLKAVSTIADCRRNFTEKFIINVEETTAKFETSIINANVDEPVVYVQSAIDANNYSWDFGLNANPQISSQDEVTVKYGTSGPTNVNLEVWSNNGCFDEISTEGANIINVPTNIESSWSLIYTGDDLYNGSYNYGEWGGHHDPETYGLTELEDGFLTFGYFNKQIFQSKYGVNLDFTDKSGGYLAKHDFNGVLKWLVYAPGTQGDRSIIFDAKTDSKGNIYLCGTWKESFFDSFGQEIPRNFSVRGGNLIKLDPRGKLIWEMEIYDFYPKRLKVDNDDNVLFAGQTNSFGSNIIHLNGEATSDEISKIERNPNTEYSLVKLDSEGALMWDSDINIESVNGRFLERIGIDKSNNIYLLGRFESRVDNYSANNNSSMTLYGPNADYGQKMFLCKYDESGNIMWQVKSLIEGTPYSGYTRPYDLYTDDDGNSYVSGRNDVTNDLESQVIYNSDGSTTRNSIGGFYIAKVNSNGICDWIHGGSYSKYGFGYKIDKVDEKLYVIGDIINEDLSINETYFTSSNGNGINVNIGSSDYFINEYDLDGNIIRSIVSGNNESELSRARITGLFKDKSSDAFYVSQNVRYYIGESGFENFGHIIPELNENEGLISKVSAMDGVVYFPNETLDTDSFQINKITINPNPASDEVNIDLGSMFSEITLSIYDIVGNKVGQFEYVDKDKIKLNLNYSSGLYLLKIQDGKNNVALKKLIIN